MFRDEGVDLSWSRNVKLANESRRLEWKLLHWNLKDATNVTKASRPES